MKKLLYFSSSLLFAFLFFVSAQKAFAATFCVDNSSPAVLTSSETYSINFSSPYICNTYCPGTGGTCGGAGNAYCTFSIPVSTSFANCGAYCADYYSYIPSSGGYCKPTGVMSCGGMNNRTLVATDGTWCTYQFDCTTLTMAGQVVTVNGACSSGSCTCNTSSVSGTCQYSASGGTYTFPPELCSNSGSTGTDAVCGTASTINKIYPSSATSYGSDTFCSSGSASPSSPAFPGQGSSVSWSCLSADGGNNASCSASRAAASTGTCDTNYFGTNQMAGCVWNWSSMGTSADSAISPSMGVPIAGTATPTSVLSSPAPLSTTVFDINFDTNPQLGLNDYFLIRYKGKFNFTNSNYIFSLGSDDGGRVYIDDNNDNVPDSGYLINNWRSGGYPSPLSTSSPVALSGTHQINYEYFERSGGARASLSWTGISVPAPDIKGTVWATWSGSGRDTVWYYGNNDGPMMAYGSANYALSWNQVNDAVSCTLNGNPVSSNATVLNTYTVPVGATSMTYTLDCVNALNQHGTDTVVINAPPQPTNLTSTCTPAATNATLGWNLPGGYSNAYYNDAVGTNNWTPSFTDNFATSTESRAVTPNQAYHFFVQSKSTALGNPWSDPVDANFTCVPAPGTINVRYTIDGVAQSANQTINYAISGPTAVASGNYTVNGTSSHTSRNAGSYTFTYNSGVPAGKVFSSVTPAVTQTLSGGSSITYTINFVTPATGTINVRYTVDGVAQSANQVINYAISGPTPVASANYTVNNTSSYTLRNAGSYTFTYTAGAPAGKTFSSITPSATQTLVGGSSITYTINFVTPTTGTINVRYTVDGVAQSANQAVTYSIAGPTAVASGSYTVNGTSSHTLRNAGSYTFAYGSGAPAGKTYSSVTPSATQTLVGGSSITYTINFVTAPPTTGTINVRYTIDGAAQSANQSINYAIAGPSPVASGNYTVNATSNFASKNAGSYTFTYNSGAPAGTSYSSVTPSVTQSLVGGSSITYTINFVTSPPSGPTGPSTPLPVADNSVCGHITINWADGSGGGTISSYQVYRWTTNAFASATNISGNLSAATHTYDDATAVVGQVYYYWVQATGPGGTAHSAITGDTSSVTSCSGNLGASDKDLVKLNGVNVTANGGVGTCQNGFDPLNNGTKFSLGDVIKFSINLCNLTGSGAVSNITVTDNMLNLKKPDAYADFNAYWGATKLIYDGDQAPGYVPAVNHYFTYNTTAAPNQTIAFRLSGSIANGGIAYLTYETQLTVPAAFSGTLARFQNGFNVSYNDGSSQTQLPTPKYTPLVPFYTGTGVPIFEEIP
ncbi:MAG: hypothetical protein HY918_03855 [Candidatus Doudnabacteria bacterium]|nr:hypothetical protein [Candidatus Doudnabacteria bacterium]